MREIKFRGKSNFGWVYGCLNYDSYKNVLIRATDFTSTLYIVNSETIGQCIGHKDKNGKEIYEWDIVLVSNQAKAIIMYDDKRAAFVLNYGQDEVPIHSEIYSSLEVIGNVFDNPEWLKGEIKL